ncbi:MAG: glycerol-3-phosphate acyltransferase [Phycisphaerales bacterium]|nr:glycerol-3-phosphate acyltransferase [Phycisphaerales bacterium]
MNPYLLIPLSFLLGSIPFGFLIGKSRGIDIRTEGSGNIGATNLGRLLGRKYFVICFILDFSKGLMPTLIAGSALGTLGYMKMNPADAWLWLAVMFAAPVGHMFTPWLGFKGGKGVATGLGALVGVMPAMTLPASGALMVFVVVVVLWRMVGVASSVAAATLPLWTWYAFAQYETFEERRVGSQTQFSELPASDIDLMVANHGLPFIVAATLLALIVINKHRPNLARAIEGTEPRIGESTGSLGAESSDSADSTG